MTPLSDHQKQLLFDYCIGLTSEQEAAEAQQLISTSKEAAEIHSMLKAALSPLESLEPEQCPDDLVESTVNRLSNLARSSQLRLQQLLADEQARPTVAKRSLWYRLGERLAVAAVFMIVGGVLITTVNTISNFARQRSWQQLCQMQLSSIWQGINLYSSDNDGKMPAVATKAGAPWWKVGYQGRENHSNTRHIWLLVKGDYVEPVNFVCPGKQQRIQISPQQLQHYNDFPDRRYVNYSFRIMCDKTRGEKAAGRMVLMSDMNPLFEKLPPDYSNSFSLEPDKKLLTLNSINHNRRGQNILFCDGAVKFVKRRCADISEDDIFTLQDIEVYKGCEVPSLNTDAFLAP